MRIVAVALVALVAGAGCLDDVLPSGPVGPRDYLRDSDYTKWVIEVDYAGGERPSDSVLSLLKQSMKDVVNKPGGVEVRLDDQLPRDERSWTTDALQVLRDDRQDAETGGETVVTHLAFLAGHSASDNADGRVLGVAIGHGQVAIFSATVKDSCTSFSLPPCLYSDDEIFRAVVVHEFGHILGLVDNGIPMVNDHEADSCNDQPDRGHSDNPGSVMYCAVETTDFLQALSGDLPTEFDADDRADLEAAGGK